MDEPDPVEPDGMGAPTVEDGNGGPAPPTSTPRIAGISV